jgi:hypothetical protein
MLHFALVFFLHNFTFFFFGFIFNMLTQFLIFQSMFSIVLAYGEGPFLILKFKKHFDIMKSLNCELLVGISFFISNMT